MPDDWLQQRGTRTMNCTSQSRVSSAAALLLGLTAGWSLAGPARADVEFTPAVHYSVGTIPIGVAVGDVDGDGAPDVICANSGTGDLSLLRNNGDGSLAMEVRLAPGGTPRHVGVGDLDGDGNADVVAVIRGGEGTGSIAVFLGEGGGVLAPPVHYGTPQFTFRLALADLDGDDDLDVAVIQAALGGVAVTVFRNAGDGTFPTSDDYEAFQATIIYTADLAAADVNGDGFSDLVAVNDCATLSCNASIAVMINAGDGTFLPSAPVDLGFDIAGAVRAGDLDGDGDADLAIVDCGVPGTDLVIAVNDGAGAFSVFSRSSANRVCAAGSIGAPEGLAIVDVDADGAPDAVLTSHLDDQIRVLMNRGDLTFDPALAFGAGDEPVAAAVGDMDGDGRPDVVTADRKIGGVPSASVLINRTPSACPEDLDGSGGVGFGDVLTVIGAWGPCGAPCPEDLSGNGTVDFADILAVIAAWGPCS
jgi:hypothetical protein